MFCEIKPILSDDYPSVLRKMKTQIKLTNINLNKTEDSILPHYYILIIRDFTSSITSREELIKIFNQTRIKIIFINDINCNSSDTVIAVPKS